MELVDAKSESYAEIDVMTCDADIKRLQGDAEVQWSSSSSSSERRERTFCVEPKEKLRDCTMGLHSVEELVTGKRSEGREAETFPGGVYEAAVNQEKQDDLKSYGGLVGGATSEESDSGGEQEETDKSGRLRLDTVDDLFNILQLRKKRRERKKPAKKREAPAPETLPQFVNEDMFLKAAMENKVSVVEKFLSDGGDPNVTDNFQRSALHKASFKGHTEVMKRLLEAGAALENTDKLDATAVHWACRGGNLSALQLLLDHGAKFTSRDKLQSTPLHVATSTPETGMETRPCTTQ
ncbi:hypothetical protein WMY93_000742 [Mugilogobius chulae]|uniref:Ankyrin repeat domain-containing protein 1 n=1 Tax=Mugilogobius chulae TaxID=88201 RepID=A0AAW0Q5Z1_9GOBI